jgi:pimeloyl-ACP methyl ester carboxylesterase
VLVHGLWMYGWIMRLMGIRLRHCGFHPVFFSYPSMRNSLSQNASLLQRMVELLPASRIHFLGHSMGGLLVLQMLATYQEQRFGRVVLAGSPYTPSAVAARLSRTKAGFYILGNGMRQWLEQSRLEPHARQELGVIAGCRSRGIGRLIHPLPKPNDGVVAVEETRVPGMRDQVILDVSHSGMLVSADVVSQACAFLRTGNFLHGRERSS